MDDFSPEEREMLRGLLAEQRRARPRSERYIKFHRLVELPTWSEEHYGQLRHDATTDKLTYGGADAWQTVLYDSDRTDLILDGTLETSGTNPTVTIGAAAGTGGSAGAVVSFGNDIAGRVVVTCGNTALSTGSIAQVNFAAARPDTNYTVQVTAGSSQLAPLGYYVTDRQTDSFEVAVTTAPGSGDTLTFAFLVIEDA